jgi:hypothetical protein
MKTHAQEESRSASFDKEFIAFSAHLDSAKVAENAC